MFGEYTEDFQAYPPYGRSGSNGRSSGEEDNNDKGLSNESL
jgi:hypothetical protein